MLSSRDSEEPQSKTMAAARVRGEGYRRGEPEREPKTRLSNPEAAPYAQKDPMVMALSPRTPSPLIERTVLSATPTPLRRQGPELSSGPPRYVFYALRADDDADIGFSASSPEEAMEPCDALTSSSPTQFLYASASPEAALFFAESSTGPGFAGANLGLPRTSAKRVVAKIDLGGFKGEVLDISTIAGCGQHQLKKDSKSWEFALDHQIVLLVGYVHPRLVTNVFNLETHPLPSWRSPAACTPRAMSFDSFSVSLPGLVKQILARDWAGENAGQRLQGATGQMQSASKQRDAQGLATDTRSRAVVCWEAKQRLDEEQQKLDAKMKNLSRHLEIVQENDSASCERAFQNALRNGSIGPAEESHILVMKGWRCTEEYPYWAATNCHADSEVWLRGTQFQTRLALNGPAAIECVHRVAEDSQAEGCPCRHCMWTKPAEFHLLRNVALDGPNVTWPPYFRLFCLDPATEELDELLNTLGGTYIRDSEHPHVFPSDEVGFSFSLDRLPLSLAGLEATLPRDNVEDTDEVALPQRPLYLVVVVPQNATYMRGQTHDEAPLYVPPCPSA